MEEAIQKARALIEAHHYIREFANKAVVVKVGGSVMDDQDQLTRLLKDLCFLDAVGIRAVVVHGGGKRITEAMKAAGLEAQFVQGRRYTDQRTLAIVEDVLVNEINRYIVDQIRGLGHHATGLHSLGSCVLAGQRLFLEGADGRRVDIGLVGEVTGVNTDLVGALLNAQYVPVLAPIAQDRSGVKLNVNADSAVGHVAAAIRAEKLVLLSDTHGIQVGEDEGFASHLTRSEIRDLVERNVVSAGMLPKVEACFTALEGGVRKTHIIDGRIPHSLLLEIFSKEGIGTEIVLD